MDKIAIYFSKNGKMVAERLNEAAAGAGIKEAEVVSGIDETETVADFGQVSVMPGDDFGKVVQVVRQAFDDGTALIFIGAMGIAVRAISRVISDKLSDSPVVVIDDNAQFVIPVIAGHMGGANKLAVSIANLLDAIPVLTTSTDVNGAFSADVFAAENRLNIMNRDGIKKVSAKALEGKAVTISIKDYPPKEPVDIIIGDDVTTDHNTVGNAVTDAESIIISDDADREYSLLLTPKKFVLGVGMKKDKDPDGFKDFIISFLRDNDIGLNDIYALATIDIKQDEPALQAFSKKHRIPVIAFEADVLNKAVGDFTSSDFVKDTIGVDNVCERAALLAAGPGGEIIIRKSKGEGVTAAVARRISV